MMISLIGVLYCYPTFSNLGSMSDMLIIDTNLKKKKKEEKNHTKNKFHTTVINVLDLKMSSSCCS
jgi:hypothetical protein